MWYGVVRPELNRRSRQPLTHFLVQYAWKLENLLTLLSLTRSIFVRINLIGGGNVATHLAQAFTRAGHEVMGVVCRDLTHAKVLADPIGALAINDIASIPPADVNIIAVPDNAVADVAQQLFESGVCSVVAHTSGATAIDALEPNPHRGVFYPCQTFTKADSVDIQQIPFLIEGSDDESCAVLMQLARSISQKVTSCDGRQRSFLHVAAVFGSNFTNHLLLNAKDFMERAGLPFDTLRPLMERTVAKAFEMGPLDAQTGPARRGDSKTIEHHEALIDNDLQKKIYHLLTQSIYETYHQRKI